MTVFDEHLSGGEYADMEFEEFLEYLVRISFVLPHYAPDQPPIPEDQEPPFVPIKIKLAARVKQILASCVPDAEMIDTTVDDEPEQEPI